MIRFYIISLLFFIYSVNSLAQPQHSSDNVTYSNSKILRILYSQYANDKEMLLLQTASQQFQDIKEIIHIYKNQKGSSVTKKTELSYAIAQNIVNALEKSATTLSDSLDLAESIYWWARLCHDSDLNQKGEELLNKASGLLNELSSCIEQDKIKKLKLCIRATALLNKGNYTYNDNHNRQDCCQDLLNYFKGKNLSTMNLCSDIDIELAMLTFSMCIIEKVENEYIVGSFQDMFKRSICQLWGDFHPYHIDREIIYAYYLSVNGQSEESIEILNKLLTMAEEKMGDNAKIQIYNMLGFAYREQGNHETSLPYYETAMLKWKQYYTTDSPLYWNLAEGYAYALYYLGETHLEKAFGVITDLLNKIEQSRGKNNFEYLEVLEFKISLLHHAEKLTELKETLQEYEKIAMHIYSNSGDLAKKICYLSDEYCFCGDFAYAEELLKFNLHLLKKNKDYVLDYAETCYCLGGIYRRGNKEEALIYYQNALNALSGKEEYTFAYLDIYSKYINVLYGMQRYRDVLTETKQLLKVCTKQEYMESRFTLQTLTSCLLSCAHLRETKMEQEYRHKYLSVLDGIKDELDRGTGYLYYAEYLSCSPIPYTNEALHFCELAETILEKYTFFNPSSYASALQTCLDVHTLLGNYDQMRMYAERIIKLYEERIGHLQNEYYKALVSMINYGISTKNLNLALPYMLKVAKLFENKTIANSTEQKEMMLQIFPPVLDLCAWAYSYSPREHEKPKYNALLQSFETTLFEIENAVERWEINGECYPVYFSLGNLYLAKREYDKAQKYYMHIKNSAISKTITYASALGSLADVCLNKKEWKGVIRYAMKALKINEQIMQENWIYNNSTLEMLIHSYIQLNDWSNAEKYAIKRFELLKKNISYLFGTLTENDRLGLYQQFHLNNFDLVSVLRSRKSVELAKEAYNATLYYKGLLLRSANNIYSSIKESGNAELITAYEEMLYLKNLFMNQQQGMGEQERVHFIMKMEEKENILITKSKDYRKNFEMQNATWTQIKDALKENELAVEYVASLDTTSNNMRYGALLLKSTSEYPEYVDLFTEQELQDILSKCRGRNISEKVNNLYKRGESRFVHGAQIYQLIFAPVEKYLDGIQTIYYSPTHTLNTIALAALCDENRKTLGELYDLRLVSSTAEIVNKTPQAELNTINLYGGIIYNEGNSLANSGSNEWAYLENSLYEVEELDSLLQKGNWITNKYTRNDVTETFFKSIEEKQPNVLHIATHGYCFPNAINEDYKNYIQQFGSNQDNIMYRSGLILSHGNEVWSGRKHLPSDCDGILLSSEVANMNLNQTSLAVLSACDTGLGIQSDCEGIYGLQRAFKLAGVQSIVMSLWQVNDVSGRKFMNYFYSNIISGMEKHLAFRKAQELLRQEYPSPNHWAAFVMLD